MTKIQKDARMDCFLKYKKIWKIEPFPASNPYLRLQKLSHPLDDQILLITFFSREI